MLEIKDYQTGVKKAEDKWKPTSEELKKKSELEDEFRIAANFRSVYENTWRENIERYEAKPFHYEDGRAGVVLPLAKIIIETKQSIESKSPPAWAYEPLDDMDDEAKTKILEDIVFKHVWYQKYVNMDYKFDLLNQDKDILGTMYQYIGYRRIFRTIRDKNLETKKITSKQELYYDDVVVDNIFPQDVWLHPLATCVADSPWLKIRKRFDYGTFLETYSDTEIYENIDKVPKGKWDTAEGEDISKRYRQYDSTDDDVVVFEHWNKMRDELIIYANGVKIFDGPNPYEHKELPFSDYIDRLQHNTYLGESECERIATIADAINAFINISIDKEKRSASGINLIDENLSEFDDVIMEFDPSKAYRVSNPQQAFVHYEIPGMNASTDRMISMLIDFLVYSTGVDFKQLTDLGTSTKATVAAIKREVTQQRIGLNIKRNENRGIVRTGWLMAKTVQQFYTQPKIDAVTGKPKMPLEYKKVRVKGKGYKEAPNSKGEYDLTSLKLGADGIGEDKIGFFQARPEYLRLKGDITVRVIPGSTLAASQELEKSKAMELLQMVPNLVEADPENPQAPKPLLSLRYIVEKLIDAFGYDKQKAFDTENKSLETVARDEATKMISSFKTSLMGEQAPVPQALPGGIKTPPPETPPSLTGANSEPIQKLQAELGQSNQL